MIRVRFAPSPTGFLHIGNARTALFNWLYARRFGGKYILRIEDTDAERSKDEYVTQVLADLRWLGLDWDEGPDVGGPHGPYRQSERLDIYQEHLQRLAAKDLAYKCYCTSEELEQRRSAALAAGKPPRYDNRCRDLAAADAARLEAEGRKPSWRFKVSGEKVVFNDLIHGRTEFDSSEIGDFVIMKSDGWPTYHFAVVVDDALMKITHVLRGVGHLPNTPLHILLFAAFGYEVPHFAHMSLTLGKDGQVLSKRRGAVALKDYGALGYLPEALANYIALLGWSPQGKGDAAGAKGSGHEAEIFTMQEAAKTFDMRDLNKAASTFDQEKLDFIAGWHVRHAGLDRVTDLALPHLQAAGFVGASVSPEERVRLKAIVDAGRPYLSHMAQIKEHVEVFWKRPAPAPEARAQLCAAPAADVLRRLAQKLEGATTLTGDALVAMVKEVQKETGVKGKALYIPLRLALTGREHGPELTIIAPILGPAECRARIRKILEQAS